jgi:ATP-dependent Clp protease ATP-binding subunit ClpC|tara:strand:- start:1833 stop:3815 length:1983 start_codon:yes stop_codon:yes gene_type:complete
MAKENKTTSIIEQYGEDLTEAARLGELDPIVGRESEINRICQILSRRKKNNPIILGDAGVGKTAIVEAIAQRIADKKVARTLFNKRIISINISNLVAGTKYRGEFEERMKTLIDELKKDRSIVVFFDEIHTIVGAGGVSGSLDASNILKPSLSTGKIQCIGATTLDEYRENIEKDAALTRRFQEVIIEPPSEKDTIEILNRLKDSYEEYHGVSYDDEAIKACVTLSNRYITQRELPDKAIDIMDEAGAKIHMRDIVVPDNIKGLEIKSAEYVRLKKDSVGKQDYEAAAKFRDLEIQKNNELKRKLKKWELSIKSERKPVTKEHIAAIIEHATGIPVTSLTDEANDIMIHMEENLHKKVIGQSDAVSAVCKVIKRSRAGVSSANKPIGSFMFIGPTGVGKSHLVKYLTDQYFGSEDNLIRIDMSEYQQSFNVSRLIGSPPGYVGHDSGGQLTEAVRRRPYSVVLFDEVEKAHPDIFNTLLQVLDEGRLTDSLGRTVDFTNTVIVMTSNIGAKKAADFGGGIGFDLSEKAGNAAESSRIETIIRKELKNKFAPEFLNRLDDIVLFNHLEEEDILKIVDIEIGAVIDRLAAQGYRIRVNKASKLFLMTEGYDRAYGARPMKRAIQNHVEDLLADAIINKKITKDTGTIYQIVHNKKNEILTIK